jgi:signal transduction histidine kinase/ligand-binding sensor domain-containing protein
MIDKRRKHITRLPSCFFIPIYFFFTLSFFFCVSLNAQHYSIQISTITDRHGTPPSATFAIVEDKSGFIWFGTIDGLYRFDGFNYKIFRNDPERKNTLSNNTIRDMKVDDKGIIWIATQGGGLDAFNPETETFTNYEHTGENENEISGNSLWSVMIDKDQDIWIGVSGKGIDKINRTNGLITHYKIRSDKSDIGQEQTVRSLLEDEEGNIWVGISNSGVSRISQLTGEVKEYFHEWGDEINLSNNQPYDIYLGHDNNLWITTFGGGINILNRSTEKFNHIRYKDIDNSLISDLTYAITERKPREYWIATEYGISVYNANTETFKNYQQSSCGGSTISENRIRTIFVDSKGIVWAGTESGVECFVTQNNFLSYTNYFTPGEESNKGIVKAIAADENQLWIGLIDNGLVRYSFKSEKYFRYFSSSEISGSLTGNNINCILIDRSKNVWLSDWNTGLMKYNPSADNFKQISNAYNEQNRLSDNRVQRILEGRKGILWIGTESGLNRYDIKADKFTSFYHNPDDSNSLSSNSIQSQAMVFDNDSNLWLGTWSFGLNKMEFINSERTKANFKHFSHNPYNANSLSNNNVISLLYDNDILWIGTFGSGLCKFEIENKKFTTYNTENGLPNNIVFAIQKDKNGNLWLSTDYGISMFNPRDESFQNYTQQDGLQDNHFFWGAAYTAPNGIIYFGGINGVNSFIPETVTPDTTPAKPVLVDIKLFNKVIETERFNETKDEVRFYYDENFISFEFAALNYSEPDMNGYRYMLKGFDREWIESKGANLASYTNLPPGKYIFRLQVSNSDGFWNKEILDLHLIIIPPWWKTWIARILFLLIITSVVFGTYKLRINILTKQKQTLETEVKNRTLEIEQKNRTLSQQKEEITSKNNELSKQKDELFNRNEKLKTTLVKLENTQNALIESEKLASLGILTAGVAHEINNPLNFISVSIENIKSALEDFNHLPCNIDAEKMIELNSLIDHSETGVQRISQIISGLKSFISNNDDALEVVHPEDIIKSATTVLEHKIPKYIQFNYHFEKTPPIKARKFRLSQVFINIIDNALDSINSKEEHKNEAIDISIKQKTYQGLDCILFQVANSGPEISEEITKKIFDPFFTTKEPNKGTGLGLYITYSIISEHKGYIYVQNEEGKVVFYIFVPIHSI